MTWENNLKRIRRYLRDPNGNIWDDALLKTIFNDVQYDLQEKTKILEEIEALRVPPSYQWSYMHDWEWSSLPTTNSQFYQCFRYHHQSQDIVTFQWEGQAATQIDSAAPDEGAQFSHPFEAFNSLTPGMEVKFRFPSNFQSMKFIAYDREPLEYTTKKHITSGDPSWITREGEPLAYFRPDDLDNSFVPYPRPSTSYTDALEGGEEGMVLYQAGDTLDSEDGDIQVRDGSTPQDNFGISLDIIEEDDNFFIIYTVKPDEIVDVRDESNFPSFLQKYIEYGVLERAYRVNNDGKIISLSEYWGYRYNLGIKFIERFKMNRKQDRDYRLTTKDRSPKRTRRGPRLPDGYPACP